MSVCGNTGTTTNVNLVWLRPGYLQLALTCSITSTVSIEDAALEFTIGQDYDTAIETIPNGGILKSINTADQIVAALRVNENLLALALPKGSHTLVYALTVTATDDTEVTLLGTIELWDGFAADGPIVQPGIPDAGTFLTTATLDPADFTIDGQVPKWDTTTESFVAGTDETGGGSGAVDSVFGRTGAVVAQTGDYTTTQVTEGANLYYTATRFNAALGAATAGDFSASVQSSFGLADSALQSGDNVSALTNDAGYSTFDGAYGSLSGIPANVTSLADLALIANRYIGTDGTGNIALLSIPPLISDTDDLTEGAANFYYTEARFDASLGAAVVGDFPASVQTSLGLADSATQPADNISTLTNDSGFITAANLSYTAASTQGTITSDAGTNATLPAADATNAGLLLPGEKTKLTGIEPGADVTDTANVTAAGALMDSEVTNLADVKAFDPADYATPADLALFEEYWNGTFTQEFDALASSDGTTVTLSLERKGGGDLVMRFSDGHSTLDCTPAQTITLTAGTDSAPTRNYVYILQSTKALTVATSGWPFGVEHIKVAFLFIPSAAYVQSSGAYINQNWNDERADIDDNMGHSAHIAEKLRLSLGATYESGLTATVSISGTPSVVTIATTAGSAYQLHRQTLAAKDMALGDDVHIVNDPVTPYRDTTDLASITTDSAGGSLNNKYFNLVFYEVINKGGSYAPFLVNLPNGSYNGLSDAIADTNGFNVVDLPDAWKTVSLPLYIFTFRRTAAGIWTLENTRDVRGSSLSGLGGANVANQTDFSDADFTIFDSADPTKILAFDAGNITATATRTITMPDADVNLGALEPTITAGTTTQYYRGDKSFQTLNAAAISDSTPVGRAVVTAVNEAAGREAIDATGYINTANLTEYRGENLNISAGVTVANLSGGGPYILRSFAGIGTEINVDVTIDGGSTVTYAGVTGQDNGAVVVETVTVPTPLYAATSLLIEVSNGTARTAGYLCHVETL